MTRMFASILVLFSTAGALATAPADGGSPSSAAATATDHGVYESAIEKARSILTPLEQQYPGLSIAVAVKGQVLWSQGFGFADSERGQRVTGGTQFRIYSLCKPLTAAALLRLAEEGRVQLDAPVARYVSGFPDSGITLIRLAGHLGGIRHYRGSEGASTRPCPNLEEALKVFRGDPLVAAPGTKFEYSSYGYVLLSAVIERASGMSYPEFLAHSVLEPAGMAATLIEDPKHPTARQATFYEADGKRAKVARYVDNRCKWGAGALLSTAEDMARFGAGLLEGRILKKASVDRMMTGMQTLKGEPTRYGIGLGCSQDSTGVRIATHSGGAIGGRSALVILPDDRIVVALLANLEGDKLLDEALRIGREFRTAGRTAQ